VLQNTINKKLYYDVKKIDLVKKTY